MHLRYKMILRRTVGILIMICLINNAWAAGPPKTSSISDPLVITLVIIMVILLLAIGLLGNIVTGAAGYMREKQKAETEKKDMPNGTTATIVTVVAALFCLTNPTMANDSVNAASALTAAGSASGSLSDTTIYVLIGVMGIELLVVFALLYQLQQIILLQKKKKEVVSKPVIRKEIFLQWWNKLNSFRSKEQEATLELEHEYDGIRELDNRLPPWWIYGFYLTIIVAGIYMWRYHIAYSAPLQVEEFQIEMAQADRQKAEYLKRTANNVDENSVVLLTAANDIEAGKKVYDINCAACHGKAGEGTVGPNLTDDYWLHGGSVSDVFKSIKYGWPDKGMKSWKDDFSPIQIAQLSGFIKHLKGTNPPNAKEPQGIVDKEEPLSKDSTDNRVAGVK